MIAEHHLAVSRTARYCTLGEPGKGVREVWFVCHGYAQLAPSFIRRFEPIAAAHRLVVAPEGLSRFYLGDHTRPAGPDSKIGASWMTREDREIEIRDYVDYLDALYDHVFRHTRRAGARVHVVGFSQGVATTCRWVLNGRARIDRLVLWGGTMPPDADLAAGQERLRALDVVLAVGSDDQFVTPKIRKAQEDRLRTAGIPFRVVEYQGGHDIDPAGLAQLVDEVMGNPKKEGATPE